MIPTPRGPTTVQITTAQTITRNISSPEDSVLVSFRCFNVNVPELCDRDAIRNPISPRATMARPTSNAIECGGLVESSGPGVQASLGFVVGRGLALVCSGPGSEGDFFFRHLRSGVFFFQILRKYSKKRTKLTSPLAIIMRIEYTMPFQTTGPENISMIGIEKPIDAWKSY
jgi:hypothetical protein